MIARREFLIVSVASIGGYFAGTLSSAATVAARFAPTAPSLDRPRGDASDSDEDPQPVDAPRTSSPRIVVFDPTFARGRALADDARRRGDVVLPLDGDAGTFWFRTVLPRLAPTGTLLEGLTSHADCFVLSTLAASAGMRAFPVSRAHDGVQTPNIERTVADGSDTHHVAWRIEAAGRVHRT